MKILKIKLSNFLSNYYQYLIFLLLIIIYFWKVFFLGEVPLPVDLVVGAYFPWLDFKWGFDVGVPVKNLITSDVVSVVYPIKSYAIDLIKNSESLLWNPLMFGGYPLFANFQIALLSPITLLYLFLPKISAWTIQIMTQPFLAMCFSYLFLREMKLSKLGSVLGSIVYAFSGFNIIWMEWGAHGQTSSFIPLILYATSKYITESKIRWGALLSLGICLQIVSGYPQLLVYTACAVVLFVFIYLRDLINLKVLFNLFIFSLLGILATSIQLIPAMELLRESQRITENLSYDLIYLPWQNWINFLAPDYFGNHATGNYWGIGNYTNVVGYTGIVPLGLSIISFFSVRKNKFAKYLILLLVFSLLFSFPFPWTKYLYSLNLPAIGASSLTRILILTNLSIAYLSAIGFDLISKKVLKKYILSGILLIVILSILIVLSFIKYNSVDSRYLISLKNLVIPFLLSLSLLITTIYLVWIKKYRNLILIFIVAMSTFELFRFGWKYTPFSKTSLVYPSTPIIDNLKSDKSLYRVHFGEVIPMNMWTTYGLSSLSGYDAVYPLLTSKFIAATNSNLTSTGPIGRHGSFDNFESRLFDLVNNKYLLTLKRNGKGEPRISGIIPKKYNLSKFRPIFEDGSVAILENKSSLPRIFFVSDWEVVKDDERVLPTLVDPQFNISKKIIISEDFDKFTQSKFTSKSEIKNIVYTSGKISFDISSDSNGFIFMSDTYYPGWEAYVDSRLTKIYKADYVFRAIPVEKGSHNILFIYNPKSFRMGKLISILSILTLILILIYGYKKNR